MTGQSRQFQAIRRRRPGWTATVEPYDSDCVCSSVTVRLGLARCCMAPARDQWPLAEVGRGRTLSQGAGTEARGCRTPQMEAREAEEEKRGWRMSPRDYVTRDCGSLRE